MEQRQGQSKARLWLFLLVFFIIILAGVVWWLVNREPKVASIVPTRLLQKTFFDVYVPARLPAGFTIEKDSFSLKDETLIFSAGKASEILAFTEQAKPKDFDFNEFYKSLANPKRLSRSEFTSVLGQYPNHTTVLSVVTDSTWLLVTTHSGLDEASANLIVQNLRSQ